MNTADDKMITALGMVFGAGDDRSIKIFGLDLITLFFIVIVDDTLITACGMVIGTGDDESNI